MLQIAANGLNVGRTPEHQAGRAAQGKGQSELEVGQVQEHGLVSVVDERVVKLGVGLVGEEVKP